MRSALSLALGLVVLGWFFPTVGPHIAATLISALDLATQIFSSAQPLG